jgi:hypothetical protein
MRVISLSTIPPRFDRIGATIQSLVNQKDAADEIRLYLPKSYRRFPEYDGGLPELPAAVTVVRPDHDLGPASKVLFAAESLRGRGAQILFCDDDQIYPPDWSRQLFSIQAERPGECVALLGKLLSPKTRRTRSGLPGARRRNPNLDLGYRSAKLLYAARRLAGAPATKPTRRRIARAGYADILMGFGGVVIRPDFLDERALDIPPILWSVDDYWLSGMLAARGIPIWLSDQPFAPLASSAADVDALFDATIEDADRWEANASCIRYMQEHFGIWHEPQRPKRR